MQISAVICTFNRFSYLRKAIQSLVNQTLDREQYEIIVVNNASTDNTEAIIEEFREFENLQYIYKSVLGLSHARNVGWQKAQGKYVAFLDDDAIADSEWLARIVVAFKTVSPQPGSIGGRVIPIWEVEKPIWVGKELECALSIVDWSDEPIFLTKDCHYLVGANIAYSRDVLQRCGGFSTVLGRRGTNLLSSEEILVERYLRKYSLGIYYDPKICVRHHIIAGRVSQSWFYKRFFWQGVSSEILSYIDFDLKENRWRYLCRGIIAIPQLLKDFNGFILMFISSNSRNIILKKCRIYNYLGHIYGRFRIGFGLIKNNNQNTF
jgi:glycosyltransferase involved in cell wall biosynthesis